jgi:hypothetical protein
VVNVAAPAFDGLVSIVHVVSTFLDAQNDLHGRNSLLLSYIYYHCIVKKYPLSDQEAAKGAF